MKSLVIATVLLFTTPAFAQDATTVAQDVANKWVASYNAGDAQGVASLFTTDGVFSPASAGLLNGRDAIANAVAGRIKAGFTKEAVTVTKAQQAGNVIWALGEYVITGSGENTGNEITGRFGGVYVREGNDWHFAMLIANGPKK